MCLESQTALSRPNGSVAWASQLGPSISLSRRFEPLAVEFAQEVFVVVGRHGMGGTLGALQARRELALCRSRYGDATSLEHPHDDVRHDCDRKHDEQELHVIRVVRGWSSGARALGPCRHRHRAHDSASQRRPNSDDGVKEFWTYTAMRLGLFVGAFVIVFAIWSVIDSTVELLWVLVIAFVISGVLSYAMLNRQRAAFAIKVEKRVERRLEASRTKEDQD